ncbi:MAG: MFS transporter [Candidatus Dormibacteria bacterium]
MPRPGRAAPAAAPAAEGSASVRRVSQPPTPLAHDGRYAALLRISGLRALAVNVTLSRLALDGMLTVTLVLTCLRLYNSAALGGLVVFLATVPGLVATPLAGALLDRRGRLTFIRLDAVVATIVLAVDAIAVVAGALSPVLLGLSAVLLSLTRPLAQAGARAQVPSMTPARLWDRVNALDSGIFTLVNVGGPVLATLVFAFTGPAAVFALEAALLLISAVVLRWVPEAFEADPQAGSLWTEMRNGLVYFGRNRTLVVLAVSSSLLNFAPGTINVVLPTVVTTQLHDPAWVVGLLFAISQGMAAVALLTVGRRGTEGIEARVLTLSALVIAAGMAVMTFPQTLATLGLGMLLFGAGEGPFWVALYSLRQRRTDPRFFSRAFILSYSGNVAGQPVASVVAGGLLGIRALVPAMLIAVGGPVLCAVIVRRLPLAPRVLDHAGERAGARGPGQLH